MRDLAVARTGAQPSRWRALAWRAAWITAVVLPLLPWPAHAQPPADSATQLDHLRAEVKSYPDSFPLVLALGTALARSATERSDDWRLRLEARKYLDKALRMRGNDPRPLLEIGMLMRKQGMRTDALRVMARAESRAEKAELEVPTKDLAQMHLEMGLTYETRWEMAEHLGQLVSSFTIGSCSDILRSTAAAGGGYMVPPSAMGWEQLASPNLVLYNFVCPKVYDELMQNWQPLDIYETDYRHMVQNFKEAFRLDPTLTEAAYRLLRHMASHDEWAEYTEVARQLARAVPDDPWTLIYLGLGYHLTGRAERADSAFTLALERAPAALRDELLEPAQLLRTHDSVTFLALNEQKRTVLGDLFWRSRDPLFLTPGNERLAEHLARLAYVDVTYGAPEKGIRGRWTDRGAAWLRYGRPIQIRAIRQGDQGLLEFWDYGAASPDLVFSRMRTFRLARNEELTEEYLHYARDRVPELYAPEHPRLIAKIPFQAAAFRDSTGEALLEIYAALPAQELRASTDAPQLETGVFVVTGDFWEPRGAVRRTRALADVDTHLDTRIPLSSGSYVVSLEAIAGDVAAQQRVRVEIPDFRTGLSLSDLLIAERFGNDQAAGEDRASFAPVVSRTLVFPAEAPIGVLWEIYGLTTDSLGVARYRVRAEVANDTHKSVDIVAPRGGGKSRVEWDASRVPRDHGALVEHLTLRLPGSKAGSYRVFITVTDLLTGQTFTAHRPIAIRKD